MVDLTFSSIGYCLTEITSPKQFHVGNGIHDDQSVVSEASTH